MTDLEDFLDGTLEGEPNVDSEGWVSIEEWEPHEHLSVEVCMSYGSTFFSERSGGCWIDGRGQGCEILHSHYWRPRSKGPLELQEKEGETE